MEKTKKGFCGAIHNCPSPPAPGGSQGKCDLVEGHYCSHVCDTCGATFRSREADKDHYKNASKSQFCLDSCPEKECYGTCGRTAGHSGSHFCYVCEKRWN